MTSIYRDFKTQVELDAAYDVEASVPDFMVYARQYLESSAQARQDLDCDLGVRFGPSVEEYVDIFPASRPNAPVLIFIHGGYWRILSAGDFSFVARGPAQADVTVVVANYALCPKVSISEITRQMRAMVAWVHRRISSFNGDPENIFVAGHSAGGHLATMCALTDWRRDYDLPSNTVRGIIPISGVFDLEPIRKTFMQQDLAISDRDIREVSPQRVVGRCDVPMLISYGGDELPEFIRQSEDFLQAWKKAGNKATFFPQLGRNHFNAISDLADAESSLCKAIFSFMGHLPRDRRRTSGLKPHRPSSLRAGGY
ncbi:alpha/beta hydrolase [Ensifer adhaerens]|uniref:Alpha/beta hydrolase n=1 Tax=Ensifer adhaerens TaxID=106592 RepID=A0A9Q9DEA7_ENSAD|nr:alpha/beta hydrolase [Ensifer adhaerens]USJ28494.1 alpha/beta hydrolase [Ensifer adhaerens]